MAMKNIIALRIFFMIANAIYVVYGIQLGSTPIILSCAIATMVHIYYLSKPLRRKYEQISKRKVQKCRRVS